MSDVLTDAFEYVLDTADEPEEMSRDEMAQYLLDHAETLEGYMRERGVDKSGEASPQELVDGLYKSEQSERIDGEMADEITKRFSPHEVENRPPSDVASLAVFYGSEVESPGSSKGDYRKDD